MSDFFTFTFNLDPYVFYEGDWNERSFTNHYGHWFIHVMRSGYDFRFMLVLSPTNPQLTPEVLEDMVVKVDFNCTNFDEYSFNMRPTQLGDSFIFQAETDSNDFNMRYYSFAIDVEIEMWEVGIPILPPPPTRKATPPPPSPKPSKTGLLTHIKKTLDEEKHADIIIKTADEKEVRANKLMLSRSPVFDAMLNSHDTKEAQEKVIDITDLSYETVKEMVHFMYTDEVPKVKEMALELLIAADKYDLPELFNECDTFLQSNINGDNFADILLTADQLQGTELKDKVIKYIVNNYNEVFASEKWKTLKETHFKLTMEVMERCFSDMQEKMKK